jgi:hypothetical protein
MSGREKVAFRELYAVQSKALMELGDAEMQRCQELCMSWKEWSHVLGTGAGP